MAVRTSGSRSTCCPSSIPRSCCTWPTRPSSIPYCRSWRTRPDGFTPLPSTPGGLALDFIRANLFDRPTMRPCRRPRPGPDNDLADKLDHFVAAGRGRPGGQGLRLRRSGGGPSRAPRDKIFGFAPGNGIHDIHMNQGNGQQFRRDDGVWQDGGLLLHYPAQQPVGGDLPGVPVPGVAHRRPDRARDRRPRARRPGGAGPHRPDRRRAGQSGRPRPRSRDRHRAQHQLRGRSTWRAGRSSTARSGG